MHTDCPPNNDGNHRSITSRKETKLNSTAAKKVIMNEGNRYFYITKIKEGKDGSQLCTKNESNLPYV